MNSMYVQFHALNSGKFVSAIKLLYIPDQLALKQFLGKLAHTVQDILNCHALW